MKNTNQKTTKNTTEADRLNEERLAYIARIKLEVGKPVDNINHPEPFILQLQRPA